MYGPTRQAADEIYSGWREVHRVESYRSTLAFLGRDAMKYMNGDMVVHPHIRLSAPECLTGRIVTALHFASRPARWTFPTGEETPVSLGNRQSVDDPTPLVCLGFHHAPPFKGAWLHTACQLSGAYKERRHEATRLCGLSAVCCRSCGAGNRWRRNYANLPVSFKASGFHVAWIGDAFLSQSGH